MPAIRPSRLEDHADLQSLLRRATLATGEHRESLLQHPEAMNVPIGNLPHTLVVEVEDRIVGFCTILPLSKTAAEVDALFIDPAAWRTGLGKALLAAAERQAAQAGVKDLTVVSGRYAQPFYEAQGFGRSGVASTRFGPAVRLSKRLTAT